MKTKEVYFLLLVYCVFFLIFIWACFLELCFALVVGGILLIAGGISRLFWFVTSCQMHGRWQRWWPWCRSGMLVGCASLRWISWLRCWCVCFKNPLPISNMLPSMIELPPCPTMVLLSQDVRLGRANDDSHGCDGIHQVRTAIYVLNSPPVNLRSDRQCRFMTKNIRVHAVTFHFHCYF